MGGLRRIAEVVEYGRMLCNIVRIGSTVQEGGVIGWFCCSEPIMHGDSRCHEVYDRADIISPKNKHVDIFVITGIRSNHGVRLFLSLCCHTLLHTCVSD